MVSDMIRVGIIGFGIMGRRHLSAYERAGQQVVAIADVNWRFSADLAPDQSVAMYSDYELMLAEQELDAVSVCTPPAMHADAAIAAATAGVAVLCEKPLAEDARKARELADIVAATGVPFMVGFFHRFHEPLMKLRDLLRENALGKPVVMRSRFSVDSDREVREWVSDVAISGGGAMVNSAVHSLDIFRYLTGSDANVSGSAVSKSLPGAVVEDTALVLLCGNEGDLGIVEAYGSAPFRTFELWMQGPEGEAIVTWDPPGLRLRRRPSTTWEALPISAVDPFERIDRGISYFCSIVAAGRQPEEATATDGVRALELVESAYRVATAFRAPKVVDGQC